jgi:CRISPR-associated endonuclease Csn1
LTVSLTSPGAVQFLSRRWQEYERSRIRIDFQQPWPGFRDAVRQAVEAIVVSHRVQAKLSGPLHEETRLGDTGETRGDARLFVKRKAVLALTAGDVEAIRDPAVQRAVKAAIAEAGGNLKQALAQEIRLPRADGTPGPVIRRVRLLVPRRDGTMRVHPTRNIHAELGPGTNHHIAIYKDGDAVRFLVTTRREAMERARRGQPVVLPMHPEGGRLVMSLRPGDVLHRRLDGRDEYRLIRKFLGSSAIFYKPLTMAVVPKPETSNRPGTLLAEGWRKISIDPIGRVTFAK